VNLVLLIELLLYWLFSLLPMIHCWVLISCLFFCLFVHSSTATLPLPLSPPTPHYISLPAYTSSALLSSICSVSARFHFIILLFCCRCLSVFPSLLSTHRSSNLLLVLCSICWHSLPPSSSIAVAASCQLLPLSLLQISAICSTYCPYLILYLCCIDLVLLYTIFFDNPPTG
jgi:hypothetical protein